MNKLKFAFFIIIIASALIFSCAPAFAHPLDEIGDVKIYDQKQTLIISPQESKLTIDLTFYPIEKIKIWESIDKNKDQIIADDEKSAWIKKGQEASSLKISDISYSFSAISADIPDYYEFFSTKPADVRIEFIVNHEIHTNETVVYFYNGKDKKLEEIEFKVKGERGLRIGNIQKQDADSIIFSVDEGNDDNTIGLGISSNSRINAFLDRFVKPKSISVSIIFLSFLVSFILGALHAMTPGHGKALVAGYLVGEKGTVANAVQLGVIITITHTASVFILGILALLLTQYVVPGDVIFIMNKISGAVIVLLGIFLLYKRTKSIREGNHMQGDHPHEHPHNHSHDEHHDFQKNGLSIKSLLPLGISGGIVPCVDALAILVVAMSLRKIATGLLLLVFFSLGLASALSLAGIAVVIAKKKAEQKIKGVVSYQKYFGIISALVVTALGFSLLFYK